MSQCDDVLCFMQQELWNCNDNYFFCIIIYESQEENLTVDFSAIGTGFSWKRVDEFRAKKFAISVTSCFKLRAQRIN